MAKNSRARTLLRDSLRKKKGLTGSLGGDEAARGEAGGAGHDTSSMQENNLSKDTDTRNPCP